MENIKRCLWVKDDFDIKYHDTEWGVPTHDDSKLFEMLILEGMQAGLTWNLILKRREEMRKAFDNFDYKIISQYTEEKEEQLLQNPKIIRNKRKISALKKNAIAFMQVQNEFGSFDKYIWGFADGKQIVNRWIKNEEIPITTELSDKISKDLKKRGFSFVGSTICYSYLQAIGIINDHLVDCFFGNKNNTAK